MSSPDLAADVVRRVLGLPADWQSLGAVAVGVPQEPLTPRPPRSGGLLEW